MMKTPSRAGTGEVGDDGREERTAAWLESEMSWISVNAVTALATT